MPDQAMGRWVVLVNDRIAHTIPPDHPAVKASRGALRSADERGHVLIAGPAPIQEGTRTLGKGDSIVIVRVTLASGAADTIARLRTAPLTIWTERDNAGKVTRAGLTQPPFFVGEEPLLLADGWVAIARLGPSRVDWLAPGGRWLRGAPLPFTEQPVNARERQAFLARRSAMSGTVQAAPPDDAWPPTIPPFQPLPLIAAPDGSVLILRTPTADLPGHRYDRVNREGRLMGRVELPPTERLAGIGVGGAYVIVTDADGIQHLRRHPWP
jgi:hypothetical protein